MWQKLSDLFVPTAHAACDPGSGGLNLWDCLVLNPDTGKTVGEVYKDPATLVNLIVRNVFVLVGIGLFVMIIIAGFKMAMSPQSKDKGDAKDMLTNAALGFMVMFGAYWIIQIIELLTGIENII